MHILLNQDDLVLHYKHDDVTALCNLAWIEMGEKSYIISPCDHTTLRGLTDHELKVLYRNTTGKELTTTNRNAILQILCDLMEAMPVTEIDIAEVEIQANSITEEFRGFYKYVAGSKKPAIVQELFSQVFKTNSLEESEALALSGHYNSLKSKPSAVKTAAPKKEKPLPFTPQKVKEPGAGTTSHRIWSLADERWGQLGKPTFKADIDFLKKQIVSDLLLEGINRSTITTQLSHWQRNRVSS